MYFGDISIFNLKNIDTMWQRSHLMKTNVYGGHIASFDQYNPIPFKLCRSPPELLQYQENMCGKVFFAYIVVHLMYLHPGDMWKPIVAYSNTVAYTFGNLSKSKPTRIPSVFI